MIQKIINKLYYKFTDKSFKEDLFPSSPIPLWKINLRLKRTLTELKNRDIENLLGELYNLPNLIAVNTWKQFLNQNPNHLGNWSCHKSKKLFATQQLEKEVILKTISLLKTNKTTIEGYITSGATEGNIFSTWLGRKHLEQFFKREKICLIKTDLTHYSVKKAADIVGVRVFTTPVDKATWSMSNQGLKQTITRLYKEGYRGFILPLTLGYTVGGSNDDYNQIGNLIKQIKRELKDVSFFIWLDAALSGLILPFMKEKFKPFANLLVQTFIVDFHKFAGVPYPAGIILYRKRLRKLIEHPIPYLKESDSTILGSRSGIPATAIWTVIHSLGKKGFKKLALECLEKKERFLGYIKKNYPDVKIISYKNSVQAALIVRKPLSKNLCQKHGLSLIKYRIQFEKKTRLIKLYKLFFLPKF